MLITDYFLKNLGLEEVKKRIEKDLVKNVLAPIMLLSKEGIKASYDSKFDETVKEIKEDVQLVSQQIDQSMKGKYSQKAVEAINTAKSSYDDI